MAEEFTASTIGTSIEVEAILKQAIAESEQCKLESEGTDREPPSIR